MYGRFQAQIRLQVLVVVVVAAAALAAMVLVVVVDNMVVVVQFVFVLVVSFVVVSHFSVQKHQTFFTSIRCMSVYLPAKVMCR